MLTHSVLLPSAEICSEGGEAGSGVHCNYDDEAQISPTICRVSEHFDYKLSTELQLKGASETRQSWWWSTNTSCHLSCFHVLGHFNYMLSAGQRERREERACIEIQCMPERVQGTHVTPSEWVGTHGEQRESLQDWKKEGKKDGEGRARAGSREKEGAK